MNKPLVKICGLQSVEVLKSMLQFPVDYIGFVFAKSKRQVTPAQAAELVQVLDLWQQPQSPLSVGVFVNPGIEELRTVLAAVPLDAVQLHGQESAAFCREIKEKFSVQVIKAVSVSDEAEEQPLQQLQSYSETVDALLLDTYDPLYGGGSGRTFAWDKALPYQTWARKQNIPLLVAGGLTPDNVTQLITAYEPDGVDVSSGVESGGVKDIVKIQAFVERVKG